MISSDLKDISLAGVGLQPFEGGALQNLSGPAKFSVNTRDRLDRRQNVDRRMELRFQGNRRVSQDRRPLKTWEKGHNL